MPVCACRAAASPGQRAGVPDASPGAAPWAPCPPPDPVDPVDPVCPVAWPPAMLSRNETPLGDP